MPPPEPAHFTPPELARRWGVHRSKVLAWLRTGELRGINLATRRGGRPRWRIPLDAVLAFEQARSAMPQPAPAPRRRRKDPAVIEYF
jgi:excisionase family DNA binding protein